MRVVAIAVLFLLAACAQGVPRETPSLVFNVLETGRVFESKKVDSGATDGGTDSGDAAVE